jgi:CheY-like chemotaxis protein
MLYALEHFERRVKFHFAKNGTEALTMLDQQKFDLVILDLNLPGLSGYDVLERCDPTRVPIVVFSISSDSADAERALKLGAREFVHKPAALQLYKDVVLQMIRKWVPVKTSKAART